MLSNFSTYEIGRTLRKWGTDGDIGIEIECEGKRLPKEKFQNGSDKFWSHHVDHSLRGEDNAEYVLTQPIKFSVVPDAIAHLWDAFKASKSVLDDSNRTSVHVHLNCQKFHLNRLAAFAALYYSVEEILTEFAGDHRVGNLFCLRGKDAPAVITGLKDFIKAQGSYSIPDGFHYSGFNIQALQKFGSIEIRTLRGATEPGVILTWVKILERLYNLSEEYKDPREICYRFSAEGPLDYYTHVLGDQASTVLDAVQWPQQKLRSSMFEGIRLIQSLCYCVDWGTYTPIVSQEDPFKRVKKDSVMPSAQAGIYQVLLSSGNFTWTDTNQVNTASMTALAPTPFFEDYNPMFDEED